MGMLAVLDDLEMAWDTGWTTRKRRRDNRTEWIPPPHLDRGQPRVNHYHHPEELLRPDQDDPG